MQNRDILAIGTSAGGVHALMKLAGGLPADLPASVLVTLHISSHFKSSLDELLSQAGALPARFAEHGERLRKARIYIAPPDRHLLVDGEQIVLGSGPRENSSRPAIDPMLRSAAVCCGHRTIGVVLTGTLSDGASGLWAVNQCGGITVVQDPSGAAYPEMPQTALELAKPDHVADLELLPKLLHRLVLEPAGTSGRPPHGARFEVEIARGETAEGATRMKEMDAIGRRSVLTCPDCQGVMWEIEEGKLSRFRCHVGHTYSADLMDLALDESLRRALGSAQRALEERVALATKLHWQAEQGGRGYMTRVWSGRIQEYEHELQVIRTAILNMEEIAAREELQRTRQGLKTRQTLS